MFNEAKAKKYHELSIISLNSAIEALKLARDFGLAHSKDAARDFLAFARQDRLSAEFYGWKRP